MKPILITIKVVAFAAEIKNKTDILIIKLTNGKLFETLQSLIIGMAN